MKKKKEEENKTRNQPEQEQIVEQDVKESKLSFKLTKKELAKRLGVSVSSLYYIRKREPVDLEIKNQIEAVLAENPAYGHKRIALALRLNKKRILRVMKKFGIKPYRRRRNKFIKKKDLGKPKTAYPNLLPNYLPLGNRPRNNFAGMNNMQSMQVIATGGTSGGTTTLAPNIVWVSDFTYIRFKEKFIYLATLMDLYTREITGFNITRFHNKELVIGALEDALTKYPKPQVVHSDQGSEYDSKAYTNLLTTLGIKISMSNKASPWENGYQESFFSHFKEEFGDFNRFDDLAELIESIYQAVWYHNNKRIHTSLKTTPVSFREYYCSKLGT